MKKPLSLFIAFSDIPNASFNAKRVQAGVANFGSRKQHNSVLSCLQDEPLLLLVAGSAMGGPHHRTDSFRLELPFGSLKLFSKLSAILAKSLAMFPL